MDGVIRSANAMSCESHLSVKPIARPFRPQPLAASHSRESRDASRAACRSRPLSPTRHSSPTLLAFSKLPSSSKTMFVVLWSSLSGVRWSSCAWWILLRCPVDAAGWDERQQLSKLLSGRKI